MDDKVRYIDYDEFVTLDFLGIIMSIVVSVDKYHDELQLYANRVKVEVAKRMYAEEKLMEANQALKALVQASPLGIIVLDPYGIVRLWNNSAQATFGWSSQETIGKFYPAITKDRLKEFMALIETVLQGDSFTALEFEKVRKDGKTVYASVSAAPLKDNEGKVIGIMLMNADVTEGKAAQEQIRYLSYHDKLTGLYNRAYFEEAISMFDNSSNLPLSVIMGDANGLKLVNDVFGHQTGDKLLMIIAGIIKKFCGKDDIAVRWGGDEFAVLLPKKSYEEALDIVNKIGAECMEAEKAAIEPSIALGLSTKYNTSQNIHQILKEAEDRMYSNKLTMSKKVRKSIIASLKETLYERSNESEAHSQKIREISLMVGKAMGLNRDELESLSLLAIVHDIGKVAIPYDILTKSGRLSEDEWDIMKRHCEIGYRIAESSHELTNIADYILSHHEKWDGNGYPQGIKGEKIPLVSRIFAVVDAFEVMTSGCVYKKPIDVEAALAEIKRCSGVQFDPAVVEALLKVLKC
jgi:diguanylate cyclase (GGDEF)-like protein/PAS domain S-box-containing protein